ncbi:hypothetical protein KSP39_PZI009888 [Platanthera zijinensis]|uniref:RING-type E3 ubiquitin transferase n=1 Tax=Platanthera zijinensis TaxID=2320716 RepID=A0AAP0G6Z8_9ASPA
MKHSTASLLTPKSSAAALASSVVFLILLPSASAYIRLRCNPNYDSIFGEPALFAVPINASDICGPLHAADPLEACSALSTNFSSPGRNDSNTGNRFVLIRRGKCSFDRKVRVSQAAGFRAAIIFDIEQSKYLISMKGNPEGIHIHAVFVSMSSGQTLQEYAYGQGECCMGPLTEENFESMLVMSFIAVVAIISAIVVIACARYWLIPRIVVRRRRNSFLDRSQVEIIPHFTFRRTHSNRNHAVKTCVICLEEYQDGQRIRRLPCHHDFHSACVDSWLTNWGTFCPICKFQLLRIL